MSRAESTALGWQGVGSRAAWQRLALALLLGVPFLLRLGAAPLFDVDEGAFAEATREMLESGDFGFTTLNGALRFDKPILVYWLQAASVAAFGLNEFALRLPSALCGWGWCLAVVHFAAPRLGRETAWLAGAVAATSLGVLAIGRAATADALLNVLLALAAFDAWRHLESGARAPLRRAYAWVGLGLLAKGPVALLVPGGAVLLHLLASGRWRDAWRAFADAPGWAILLAIAVPWYAYALHRHGQAFIDGFIVRHNLARYGSVLEGHRGSALYYVVVMPVLLLPWSLLLGPVLARARRLWAVPLTRFLLVWAAFVLAFFSFSSTKLPHYALYGATPLFLLLAQAAQAAPRRAAWLVWPLQAALLLAIALLPALATHEAHRVKEPLYRALLEGAQALDGGVLPAAAAAAFVLALLAAWRLRPPVAGLAAAGGAFALVLSGAAVPWLARVLQEPVREAGELARGRPEPGIQWGLHQPSFSVYRGRSTPKQGIDEPLPPGTIALVRADRLPADAPARVWWRGRGFVLVEAAPAPSVR